MAVLLKYIEHNLVAEKINFEYLNKDTGSSRDSRVITFIASTWT